MLTVPHMTRVLPRGAGHLNEAELEVQTLRATVEDSSQRASRLEASLEAAKKEQAEVQSYAEERDERIEVCSPVPGLSVMRSRGLVTIFTLRVCPSV